MNLDEYKRRRVRTVSYTADKLVKKRTGENKMENLDSINSVYCPHIGLFGANILDTKNEKELPESVNTSLDDSLSTTDSQSTISVASIPIADSLHTVTLLTPPASPPSPTATNGQITPDLCSKVNEIEQDGSGELVEQALRALTKEEVIVNGFSGNSVSGERSQPHGDCVIPAKSGDDVGLDSTDSPRIKETEVQPVIVNTERSPNEKQKGTRTLAPIRTKKRIVCSQCKAKTNLWKCLGLECGLLLCGAHGKNHANSHYQENPDHVVQENVSSRKLWCNVCNHEVFRDFRNRRSVPAIWFPRDDREDFPPRGLYNIGNTCYMNAALQNIASIAPLTSYLMGDTFHDDETRSRRVFGSYRMFLEELMGHVNSTYLSAVMPSRLLYAIRLAHPMFRGFHQHDSQEFLRLIMDTLATETKVPHFTLDDVTVTSSSSENQDCERESDTESFETADSGNGSEGTRSTVTNGMAHEKRKDSSSEDADTMETETVTSSTIPSVKVTMKSILDDVCNGQLESSVQCLSCHETSRRLEVFQDLSLPIPTRDELAALHQREERYLEDAVEDSLGWYDWAVDWIKWFLWGPSPTINECLGAFFSSDELKGKNMYSCEKCKTLRNGLKRCSLYHLPEVLCVHLKRFRMVDSSPGSSPHKISKFVKFPLDDLDVRPFLHPDCPDRVTNYRLMGVICHHGSAGVGHYTAYIRKRDTWFITDDCRVCEVSSQEVENCEAYVLFYHKWDTEQEEDEAKRNLLATWAKCDISQEPTIKFHLISRKWLTQYMWGEEEMPLDNTDVVCPHGRLVPVDNLEMSATWIPDVVWDAIVDRYGGGPDLVSPEVCQICTVVWKKYQRTTIQQRTTSCTTSRSYSYSFSAMANEGSLSQFLSPKRQPRTRLDSNDSLSSNGTTGGTLPEWQ